MSLSMKLQATSIVLLFLVTASTPVFADIISSRYLDQTALVFMAEDVKSRKLPIRIHVHNVPVIFGSQISLACLGVNARAGELIAFLPKSQSCILLTELSASRNSDLDPNSYRGFARDRAKLKQRLEESQFVIMQPQVIADGAAAVCYCPPPPPPPGNATPVVRVISGSPQEVVVSTLVTTIGFSATDKDSPTLQGSFSYTLDGGSSVAGLPAGLARNCVPGTKSLYCSVNGTAPAITGSYLIRLAVWDGEKTGSATASLTVTPDQPLGRIFSDGFEDLP